MSIYFVWKRPIRPSDRDGLGVNESAHGPGTTVDQATESLTGVGRQGHPVLDRVWPMVGMTDARRSSRSHTPAVFRASGFLYGRSLGLSLGPDAPN